MAGRGGSPSCRSILVCARTLTCTRTVLLVEALPFGDCLHTSGLTLAYQYNDRGVCPLRPLFCCKIITGGESNPTNIDLVLYSKKRASPSPRADLLSQHITPPNTTQQMSDIRLQRVYSVVQCNTVSHSKCGAKIYGANTCGANTWGANTCGATTCGAKTRNMRTWDEAGATECGAKACGSKHGSRNMYHPTIQRRSRGGDHSTTVTVATTTAVLTVVTAAVTAIITTTVTKRGREEDYSCRNRSKVRVSVMLCARHRVVQTTWQGQGGGSPCAEDLVASKTLSYQRRCRIEDLRGCDTHRGSSDPLCGGALSYRLQSPQPPAASKQRTRDANTLESAYLDQHASISMP